MQINECPSQKIGFYTFHGKTDTNLLSIYLCTEIRKQPAV